MTFDGYTFDELVKELHLVTNEHHFINGKNNPFYCAFIPINGMFIELKPNGTWYVDTAPYCS